MHRTEYEIMRQKFNGKLAVKNSFVFVWLTFVIFIGILIVAYVWNLDIEDGWRWTAFALILTLSILLLLIFAAGYAMGRLPKACIGQLDESHGEGHHNQGHHGHQGQGGNNMNTGYSGTRIMGSPSC